MTAFKFLLFILFSIFLNPVQYSMATPSPANLNAAENCVDCHQEQVNQWTKSDHAKAMDIASDKTVLGNFNNQSANHFSQTAKFYKKGNEFWVSLEHEGKIQTFKVIYTFGHYPLQQYLIKAGNGKYQVFPFSWDSRPQKEGGQRWYPVYENEDIKSADRLHWQQPLQTWNGMCADCHSDGLKRQYSVANDSFNSTYDNINVGCQSCHGKMSKHVKKPTKLTNAKYDNQWMIKAGQATATWQGEKRDNSFMDNCFACHSLRSPLTDGIVHDEAFLNQFAPSFLEPNLYQADGQIKEEVYVYGSFLQSKMFKAGVNCLDCHDKHTMKIKVPGNGLCLQCHNSEVFEQKSHHQHQENTEASQCVTCHMPETRYMGVDDRRDHSFKVPRPHLSNTFNIPNVCVDCHKEKSNDWAAKNVEKWHGKAKPLSASEQTYLALQNGQAVSIDAHLALINDTKINAIYRATAISLLMNSTNGLSDTIAKKWIESEEPLIRLAIARMGNLIPENERHLSFSSLLNDQYKAIRAAAANQLLSANFKDLSGLKKAFDELIVMNNVNAWRGEGRLNQSMVHVAKAEFDKAKAALNGAIKVDPYFEASYINLADLYRNTGDAKNEAKTYQQGVKANPKSAVMYYSYGLYLIRNQKKQAAIDAFKTALKLQPDNSQYTYIYLLALDSVGKTKQALSTLKMQLKKYKDNAQMLQLGLSFSKKLQDRNSYISFYQHLQKLQ